MKVLLKHELKYYFKNRIELIQFISLFVSIVLLIPFGQAIEKFDYQSLAAGILWIALTVAASLAGSQLFQRDYDSGKLEAYQIAHVSLEEMVLAKWLGYLLALLVPIALILPLILLMLNVALADWSHYYIGIGSGAVAVTLIIALASVLMVGTQRVGAVLALVVLPLTIPVIIFGSHYLAAPQTLLQPSLYFLWGFAAFLTPILCLTGASCIRASN